MCFAGCLDILLQGSKAITSSGGQIPRLGIFISSLVIFVGSLLSGGASFRAEKDHLVFDFSEICTDCHKRKTTLTCDTRDT